MGQQGEFWLQRWFDGQGLPVCRGHCHRNRGLLPVHCCRRLLQEQLHHRHPPGWCDWLQGCGQQRFFSSECPRQQPSFRRHPGRPIRLPAVHRRCHHLWVRLQLGSRCLGCWLRRKHHQGEEQLGKQLGRKRLCEHRCQPVWHHHLSLLPNRFRLRGSLSE